MTLYIIHLHVCGRVCVCICVCVVHMATVVHLALADTFANNVILDIIIMRFQYIVNELHMIIVIIMIISRLL